MARRGKYDKAISALIRERRLIEAVIPETTEEKIAKYYELKEIDKEINALRRINSRS